MRAGFGEQFITTKPTQATTYRGGTEILAEDAIPSGRVEVVPANGANPGVDVGDVFSGATVGPVDYSQFGGYLIAATTLGTAQHNHLARVTATAQTSRQLAVATYNVENLAPGDPAAKYQRLAEGVVTNLSKPDVVAIEEVQDNTGATDDGTVAADQTLTKLTDAIVAAGGPRYRWREIDPVDDKDGGRPALPLARDRSGRRQGRRAARRQHPRRLPVRPVARLVRRSRLVVGQPLYHGHGGGQEPRRPGAHAVAGADRPGQPGGP